MERNLQKNGLINLVILLIAGVSTLLVSGYTHSVAGEVVCVFLGLGVLIAGVSWFQMRLEEQERLEKLEQDEIGRAGSGERLFGGESNDVLPAKRSRLLFEKYFVRGFTVVLFLLQAGGAWLLWHWLPEPPAEPLQRPMLAMALLGMFALVLYLIGKFAAGLTELEGQRLLRPGSNYLLLGAYLEALVVLGLIAVQADFPNVDLYLAYVLTIVLGLLAVENLFGLLFEIYRPRIRGQVGMLLYDSRLVGLLSRPEGLFTTAAHALDYQFGFKVSETWFYKFLQQALAWIILAQVGILLLSTCFVFVDAGEEVLLERFGRPVSGSQTLKPGLHFKLPWPIDRAHRFHTLQIQSFAVGFEHEAEDAHGEDDAHGEEDTLLWTVSHYQEEYHLLVASRDTYGTTNQVGGRKSPPVNLLSLGIPVHYQISNVVDWAYQNEDASTLLKNIATREVVRYLVGVDMEAIMTTNRFPAAVALRERIQRRANEQRLGVSVLFVGLQDIHPPVRVAHAYEDVVAARQRREADLLSAQAHKVRTNALAHARSLQLTREAKAEQRRVQVGSLARAALFTNQLPAFTAAPSVYATRAYLELLGQQAGDARKIILATTNTRNVVLLNLEEKIRTDILDVPLPATK